MINIDENQKRVLQMLCGSSQYVSLEEFQSKLNVSKRTVYYLINKVNETLLIYSIDPIQNKRSYGYYLDENQKEKISTLFHKSLVESSLKSEDRVNCLICWLLYPDRIVHVDTIIDYFGVSRNSVFSDLKKVKEEIKKYHLKLDYGSKTGYRIKGELPNYHAIFLHFIARVLQKMSYRSLSFLNVSEVELYYGRLMEISDKLGDEYKGDNYLLSLSCLLSIIHHENEQFDFSLLELKSLGKTEELNLIDKYFQDFNVHERLYLSIYLLGSKVGGTVAYQNDEKDIELYELSQVLTEKFEKDSRISLSDKNGLINSLYVHFKLSFYYYTISIQVMNPFIEDLKKNYFDLFVITRDLCLANENLFPFPLSESEIGYITIHFGGHIRNDLNAAYRKFKVLVVCPSGISTSVLLKKEIENTFFNISVIDSVSVADVSNVKRDIDFIVTTVDIQTEVPYVKVHTILSQEDKSRIASLIALNDNALVHSRNGIQELLNIIYKYVPPANQLNVKNEIMQFIREGNPLLKMSENSKLRVYEILGVDEIILANKKMEWKEGISLASKPLLKNGTIRLEYISSMINLGNEYGPYFVLRNGVAIAHGRSDEGANLLGLSLLINKAGISFEDNLIVKLLFVLSSPDQHKHLRILRDIMEISENQDMIHDILKLNTSKFVLSKLKYHFEKNAK